MFGGYKIQSAGRDAVTRNTAYRLTGIKTPETPDTTKLELETSSRTLETNDPDAGCFEPDDGKTPGKHPQNTRRENSVRDGTNSTSPGVTGVSGVQNRPAAQRSAPPEVGTLYRQFKAGHFSDRPELHSELGQLFTLSRVNAQQRARLLELAHEARA